MKQRLEYLSFFVDDTIVYIENIAEYDTGIEMNLTHDTNTPLINIIDIFYCVQVKNSPQHRQI